MSEYEITILGNLTVTVEAPDEKAARAALNEAFTVSNTTDPLVGATIQIGDQHARVLGFVSYGIEILGTPIRREGEASREDGVSP